MASLTEGSICEKDSRLTEPNKTIGLQPKNKYRLLVIFQFAALHIVTLYTIIFTLHLVTFWTYIYTLVLIVLGVLGTTAGPHRLWSHRSYEATWPLRLFLVICCSLCCQISVYDWARFHRVHHQYVDTEADPYNSKRGFFFSHIGWTMISKTPECRQKLNEVDMSDVLKDPISNFYSRFFFQMNILMLFIPMIIPIYFWGENATLCFLVTSFLRTTIINHCIFSINSVAHMFGTKPYNKRICPVETALVSFLALGEGWHNYHHTFPWDYKAGEFGDHLNLTARFIHLCSKLGLAYNLKTASPHMIARMKETHGDGSHVNKSIY